MFYKGIYWAVAILRLERLRTPVAAQSKKLGYFGIEDLEAPWTVAGVELTLKGQRGQSLRLAEHSSIVSLFIQLS